MMKKVTNVNQVKVGDFIYVESTGYILEVVKSKPVRGKYTLLGSLYLAIKFNWTNVYLFN